MKNISRRVFIKGLAVAGVAAAASTVLAGCNTNMIPGGNTEGEGEGEGETSASNVLTLTSDADSSKTFTLDFGKLEVGSVAFGNEKAAAVRVNLTNKLGKDAYINPDATGNTTTGSAKGDLFVVISAYKNGLSGNEVTLQNYTAAATDLKDIKIAEGSDMKILYLADSTGIDTLTVKVALKRFVNISANAAEVASEEIESKTYTYTL